MAISEPVNFLPDWPGWNSLALRYRQEKSGQAGGTILVKDIGDPIWTMTAQSKRLAPNALDIWRARLEAMEGGLVTFYGYALSRTYPIAHPNGTWPEPDTFHGTTAQVHVVSSAKSLRLKSLPEGFIISVGDMLSIRGTDLHRVMEAAEADSGGVTDEFEVRPHLWDGVAVNQQVNFFRPRCIMAIEPGSIDAQADLSGRGAISFRAFEVR